MGTHTVYSPIPLIFVYTLAPACRTALQLARICLQAACSLRNPQNPCRAQPYFLSRRLIMVVLQIGALFFQNKFLNTQNVGIKQRQHTAFSQLSSFSLEISFSLKDLHSTRVSNYFLFSFITLVSISIVIRAQFIWFFVSMRRPVRNQISFREEYVCYYNFYELKLCVTNVCF